MFEMESKLHAGNCPLWMERCDDLFFKLAVPSDTLTKWLQKELTAFQNICTA